MKVPVAAEATSCCSRACLHASTRAGSFAHEIDLLGVLALDLNTNDFPLFSSPHSVFLLLETTELGEFNSKRISEGAEGVRDKMGG